MLRIAATRARVGVLIPVHFEPSVLPETIRHILENTLADQHLFCDPENTLLVVDRDSTAEMILRSVEPGSPLHGLPVHSLDENRGKTGAVRDGLGRLLETSRVPYLVTRDCDGDNQLEDLTRLVAAAEDMVRMSGVDTISVFGARPSLTKPMNWVRQQWEVLTNQLTLELTNFLLARDERVLDRRFWNGYPLDLQSGYRLYSRGAARIAVDSLCSLPDRREVYMMACEMLPFTDLSLRGGIIGQVQRGTHVEQPVSSYAQLDFGCYYGELFGFMAGRYGVSRKLLTALFDNQLVDSSAYFSSYREEFLECRRRIDQGAAPLQLPRFL